MMPTPATRTIGAGGQSVKWCTQKKNVVRIFDLFMDQDEELSTGAANNWHALDEQALCGPHLVENPATEAQ